MSNNLIPDQVQDLGTASGSGATVILTLAGLGSPTKVGNMAAVYVRTGGGTTLSTVTDSKGNVWTVNEKGTSANTNSAIATTILTTALVNGDTITITPSAANPNAIFGAAEFKNVAQSAAGVACVSTPANGHGASSPISLSCASSQAYSLGLSVAAISLPTSNVTVGSADSGTGGTWSQLGSVATGVGAAYEAAPNSVDTFDVSWSASGNPTNLDVSMVTFNPALCITNSGALPGGSIGTAYSKTLFGAGGIGSSRTWSISSGTLPAGLSLSGSTISGTPTTNGTSSFTVEVTDTGGNVATLACSITIGNAFSITTGATLTSGTKGTAYGPVSFATSGGTGTVTWSLLSGVMPPGLNLSGSTTTSQLFGCTFATSPKTNVPAWSKAVSAIQWCKLYYTPAAGFPAPATLADADQDVQEAVANGTQVFLCYHPTAWGSSTDSNWPGTGNKPTQTIMNNEQSALLTSIQAHLNIGLNIKAVVFNQELDGSKTYIPGQPKFLLTGDQATYPYYWNYHAVKSAFPDIDVAICYVNYNVDTASSRAAYFPGPTQTNPHGWGPVSGKCYVDGIILDAYADVSVNKPSRYAYSSSPSTSPNWADIADYNGIKFGYGETGNSATGGSSTVANMTLYLSAETYEGNPGDPTNSLVGVARYRLANQKPCYPFMWYENGGPNAPGYNNIDISSGTSDYRIGMLQDLAATLASHVGGQISGTPQKNGTYSFELQATDSTGATATQTFSLTIGTSGASLAFNNSGTLSPATVGVEDSFTWSVSNGTPPYTFSIVSGALPTGVTLTDTVNGVMDGTPTTAADYSWTIKVTDSATPTPNTATQSCTQKVVPQTVTEEPYLIGGASAASGGSNLTLDIPIQTGTNSGDFIQVAVLATSTQTISVSDTAGNTYNLAESDTTETGTQLYIFEADGASPLSPVPDPISGNPDSIAVTYSDNTSAQLAIAVGDNGTELRDKLIIAHGSSTTPSSGSTGTLSTTEEHAIAFIANTSTGGTPAWATPFSGNVLDTETVSGVASLSAAMTTVTANTALTASATITSAPWTAAMTTFEAIAPTLSIDLADGIEGDPYIQTCTADNGVAPYTYGAIGLPSGLAIASGVISGTPIEAGDFDVTITVTDSNGVSAQAEQTITILASGSASAPTVVLPGNLLSVADSDFEEGIGSWVNSNNATGLTTTTNDAVTGVSSLRWQAAADGSTSIQSGVVQGIVGGAPYIVSAYILSTSNDAPNLWIGVNWFDSTGTFISSTSSGGSALNAPLQWQAVQAALTAPSNAAKAEVFAIVDVANAGDMSYLDTVYFAPAKTQVLIDWVNPPFAVSGSLAGADFMDVTPWTRLDQNITFSRGRQDMISEIQPASGTLYLQNDSGMFTRYREESLPASTGGEVSIQRRVQINEFDGAGNWVTRFDGNISEIDYTFDSTGNTSLAQINLTDILGYLNRADMLYCWTKNQVLADMPLYHWTLDDPGNAGGAGVFTESSGNSGPPLRLWNNDLSKTAKIAFQDTTGGVETLADAVSPARSDGSEYWPTGSNQPNNYLRGLDSGAVGPYTASLGSVYLTPKLTTQTAQNTFLGNTGYQLQTQLPTPIAPNATGTDYSIEAWFTVDPTVATDVADDYGPYTVLSLGTSRKGECLIAAIYIDGPGNSYAMHVQTYDQPPTFLGKNYPSAPAPTTTADMSTPLARGAGTNGMDKVQVPHHLVITIQGDPSNPLVIAWLDGYSFNFTGFNLSAKQYFDTICVGGAFGGDGCHYGGIQLVSIYGYALSQAQITDHCMLGQYGMWEQTTDDCIARLAGFANIPPFWNNLSAQHDGLTLTDYQSVAGYSPLSAMQAYESTEQGLLFAAANGAINFHTRDWRMGYGAPDLQLPPESFAPDMGYQVVDQFMQNGSAIATQIYPTGVAYTNQASQDQYGPYVTNSPTAPAQFPLITFNRAEGQLGLPSFGLNPDPNLSDLAAWDANAYADPYLLPGQVTLDILTIDPNDGYTIADVFALDIGNMVTPSGTLPASFPDAPGTIEWFIEGVTETIGVSQHTVQFYCSPAQPQRAWIPGDSTYGILGQTTRVGISSTDLSTPPADGKDVSHDAGGPYWAPTFTSDMNNPAENNHGFVGALDMRGLVEPVSRMLNPPMCIVSAINQTQSVGNGSLSSPHIFWDTIHVDTEGGMGLIPSWPNWYVCTVPGFYDIDGCLTWSTGVVGGYMGQTWIVVAQKAAQGLAAGTSTPLTNPQYVCPVGESPRWNFQNLNVVNNPGTRIYLGLGDMVTLAAEQNSTSSVSTGTNLNGSHMSILFRGFATEDDGCQFNNSLGSGGTVTDKPKVTTYTKTYSNTHTYTYDGKFDGYKNRVTGTPVVVYQGQKPGGTPKNSQSSQIAFPYNTIHSDLNPDTGTVSIKSCSITGTNIYTALDTGCYAAFGYSSTTPGQATFDAHQETHKDVQYRKFLTGQTLTGSLPTEFAEAFQDNARMIFLGDSNDYKNADYGKWQGGPGSWLFTIVYTVTT